jgi:hypothetical protein
MQGFKDFILDIWHPEANTRWVWNTPSLASKYELAQFSKREKVAQLHDQMCQIAYIHNL